MTSKQRHAGCFVASKPLTLRPHEARRLAAAGRVVVIRAVEPQPPDDPMFGDDPSKLFETHLECPFGPPGTKLWGRETWWQNGFWACDAWHGWSPSEVDNPDCGRRFDPPRAGYESHWRKRSPATMPKWASRFPRVVHVGTRLCRLGGVTEEEAKGAGYDDIFEPGDRPFRDSGGNWAYCPEHGYCFDLIDCWNRDNPKHPAAGDPWAWVALLRRED